MRLYPVIMCGGGGTRLWPASRPARPKPFLPLNGPLSLFQEAVSRVAGLADAESPLIVGSADHQDWIGTQLGEIGVDATLILEPSGRDSAPAIAAAALWILDQDPEGIAVIVASDHGIPDAGAFREAITSAAAEAQDRLVVLGVHPTGPSEAYGYIRTGAPLGRLKEVAHFVEKPDAETARRYLADGYLWNSGNLVASARALVEELELHAPDVLAATRTALCQAGSEGRVVQLGQEFSQAPRISMDFAVLNRTRRAAVLPVAFAWSDLGAWEAVWQAAPKDQNGNAAQGSAAFLDAEDCLVRGAPGQTVGVVGLSNVAVIVEPDAILVSDLRHSQGVRDLAGIAAAAASGSADPPADPVKGLRTWLDATALPLWWALGADHERGGFHEQLTHEGKPLDLPRRARVQARQAYVYAAAGLSGWTGPWRTACGHALDFLLANYVRPDGLVRSSVGRDGTVIDDTPRLYDQAFVLLALATAAKAIGRDDLLRYARAIGEALGHFRLDGGGFREEGDDPFQANCHMHLLESSLALVGVDAAGPWADLSDELVGLALARFIQPGSGRLVEFFDTDWRPRLQDGVAVVDPGHQYEWAWLLSQYGSLRGRTDLGGVVTGLLESGKDGLDRRGGVINQIDDHGRPLDRRARLWPQTERLRATLLTAAGPAERRQAVDALTPYLGTSLPGLWHDQMDEQGLPMKGHVLASSLYHLTGAILAVSGQEDQSRAARNTA